MITSLHIPDSVYLQGGKVYYSSNLLDYIFVHVRAQNNNGRYAKFMSIYSSRIDFLQDLTYRYLYDSAICECL